MKGMSARRWRESKDTATSEEDILGWGKNVNENKNKELKTAEQEGRNDNNSARTMQITSPETESLSQTRPGLIEI